MGKFNLTRRKGVFTRAGKLTLPSFFLVLDLMEPSILSMWSLLPLKEHSLLEI